MIISIRQFILPLCKLNKFAKIRKYVVRRNSSDSTPKVLECLSHRSVLRLSGHETPDFLQGLITNDMKHLEEGAANIYALFLNFKGRVLYDSIIYKSNENGIYYVECDSKVTSSLIRHLKMYRLKRKIEIDDLNNQMEIWSLFDPTLYSNEQDTSVKDPKLEGLIFPCGTLNNQASKITDDIMIYKDPRIQDLGYRILAKANMENEDIVKCLDSGVSETSTSPNYRSFLYKLGIGEGFDDLQQGKAFPMEINGDYLHGISFHKGCYVGQELTARTHHTGVIRKRLMPIIFNDIPNKDYQYDQDIVNEAGKKVGSFKGREGIYGLGLIRIAESLKSQALNICGTPIKVVKPSWWPQEAEKASALADDRK